MPSFNRCILMGHLTRDIEIRYLQSGAAVGDLSLAVNRHWTNDAGEKQQEVSFLNCVAFGKQAETLAQYVRKGSALMIEGRLKQETWDDKTTSKPRSAIKIIVEGFQFIDSKPKDEQSPRAQQSAAPAPTEDENIPF